MAISKNEIITVNGIIIGAYDIREIDKLIEILTDELGRIKAFAFSSKSQKSTKLASSRLFTTGIFELIKNNDTYSIVSIEVKNYYDGLVNDYNKYCLGTKFIKQIKDITYENMDCHKELSLLCYSLSALLSSNIKDEVVEKVFEIKLAEISGINEPAEMIVSKYNLKSPKNIKDLIDHIYNLDIKNLYKFNLEGDLYDDFMKIKIDFKSNI